MFLNLFQRYIRNVKKQSIADAAVAITVPPAPSVPSGSAPAGNRDTLLAEFRRQTGMNSVFARQCLDEFNWDFSSAVNSFQVMHSAGKIPQSAFAPD